MAFSVEPKVAALLLLVACESPGEPHMNPAPEHVSAHIPLNKEVRGESLEEPGDVDEFTFDATDDGRYDVFVQSVNAVRAELSTDSQVVASATTQPGDTSLFAHHTGVIAVVHAAPYVIRVTAANSLDSTTVGPYRLFLHAVDRRPEHIDSLFVAGDTVAGETIDSSVDIDEFTFTGTAGAEYNLFFQGQNGLGGTLVANAHDADGTTLGQAISLGTDTSLGQGSGRFALKTNGKARVEVLVAYPANPGNLGPYRFFLYPINRQPESRPNALAFGDSLSGEGIELPGDVDEFRVSVPTPSGANLVLQSDSASQGWGMRASLVNSTNQVVAEAQTFEAGSVAQSGRVELNSGNYILRVDGNGEFPSTPGRAPPRGAYRLWMYRFSISPEAVSGALTIPDTVNEPINPPGDEDVFQFNGTRREHINIALQGTAGPPSGGGFWVFLRNGNFPLALVSAPLSGGTLGSYQTGRLDLPATAAYTISVTGAGSPEALSEIGPYRLAVTHVPTSPEHVSSAIALGDSVTSEAIDSPGDWDEFTLTATPGADLGLFFASGATTYYPYILVSNPLTGDSLAGTVAQGRRFAGPFKVPNSGQLSVAVFERPNTGGLRECYDACGWVYQYTGAYEFNIVSINRAPETRSAVYLTGDTVRGEAIDPPGDIDEFSAHTVPGLGLTPYFRLTADPANGTGLMIEIIDPATGSPLSGNNTHFTLATTGFNSLPSFTVPPSGDYIIRVRGSGIFGDEFATAPYEFVIKP
jgi:hypothetical protein